MKKTIVKRFITIMILALAASIFAGCLDNLNDDDWTSYFKAKGVFIVTTDYLAAGRIAIIHGDPPTKLKQPDVEVSSDPAARYYNGKVYVINRYGFDNIQVLDPDKDYETIAEYNVGGGSNPQDIAFASKSKAYVSRLNDSQIRVLKPKTGDVLTSIDLAAYADGDGIPEASKMLVVGDRLFIALQRLNFFMPTDKSTIVVIDTADNSIVDAIDLATTNPVTDLYYDDVNSKLYVGCAGGFKAFGTPDDDGAIESISVDLLTDTYTADGVLIGEATLGGDVTALAFASSTQAYAIVQDADGNNTLYRFDPTNPAGGLTQIWTTSSYIPAMAMYDLGYLIIADADFTTPGIRVLDTLDDTFVTADPIDVGLPPVGLAVMR